ncbi:DUF1194 domain-containing protein [Pelagibius sp. 7325]|uniref:DUF1194 domain-containing protein n=1 Tax=Pelagibius sp. 7325 TaxID=3131994 RepID=UPI0030EDCB35
MGRALPAGLVLWLAASGFAAAPAPAAQLVHLELVLAVDCSSSVNLHEFELQMEGIAAAFEDPAVLAALEQAGSRGIAVSLLQWSSAAAQTRAVGWTRIAGRGDALAFANTVRTTGRMVTGGATALGNAIDAAVLWTQTNGFQGERQVIDVSGDGRSNEGGSPAFARAAANSLGITINGLAILNEEPRLARYYLAGVVGGPGAFLLTADDFDDFAVAMRRKLYFEIVGPPIAAAPGGTAATAQQIAAPHRR